MFIFKQSSFPWVVVLPSGNTSAHVGGGAVASSVPGHGAAGCGGRHRSAPIGGAANGTPRNAHEAPLSAPWTAPLTVVTKQEAPWTCTDCDDQSGEPATNAKTTTEILDRDCMTSSGRIDDEQP
jgi:hypothetical protein